MCFGGGSQPYGPAPNDVATQTAQAQEDEQRREYEAQLQLQKDQLAAQQDEWKRQYQDAQDRYSQQQTQWQSQYDQQNQALLAQQQQAEKDRQTYLGQQQDAQRMAQTQAEAAANKATVASMNARNWATGRQDMIDSSLGSIDKAFAGADQMAGQYGQSLLDAEKPGINRQYDNEQRSARFKLADNGNLNSNAAAYRFSEIGKDRGQALTGAAMSAGDKANSYLQTLKGQQAQAKNSVLGAVSQIATPDFNTTAAQINDDLGGLGKSLNGITAGVRPTTMSMPSAF